MLTGKAQTLRQSAIATIPRHRCCCKPHEIGAASAQFNSPLAESARPATTEVKLLQSRQRPGPADKDLRWLAQVMAPSDGLTARQNRRPCNAICTRPLIAGHVSRGAIWRTPRPGTRLNPMNRLAAAIAIGANAAYRGGEKEDLGT